MVSQLIKKEVGNVDTDAVKKVLDSGIANPSTSLTDGMNSNTVEFDNATITNSLVDAGKTSVTVFDETSATTAVTAAVEDSKLATGTTWGGNWFVLNATEEDSDELAAGSCIALYLDGSADSTSGKIGTCVNVSPNPHNGTVDSEEVFENEYIGGRWAKISSGRVSLTFDYEGQEFQGAMKAKAFTDENQQLYRFSSEIDGVTEQGDRKLNTNGVSALANVGRPASANDCSSTVNTRL